jgi:thiosulfate/3-mercaptopyruvate sulfurtransferase
MPPPGPLVQPDWLRAHHAEAVILDASYYLPTEGKDAAALFLAGHLPGARFFDIDKISDPATPLPHMLPTPADFAEAAAALGAADDRMIVVYDQRGIFSSARAWWMFRVFGHDNVCVLDGGLPAWIAAGGALETGTPPPAPQALFTPAFRPDMVRSLPEMLENLSHPAATVLDARSAARFDGSVAEPRAGMKSGHIPGARSLPFGDLLSDGRLRPPAELRARFAAAGIDPSRPTITTCGSGVTAAVLNLAAIVAGLPEPALYDGSWSEWGSRDDTPIEV